MKTSSITKAIKYLLLCLTLSSVLTSNSWADFAPIMVGDIIIMVPIASSSSPGSGPAPGNGPTPVINPIISTNTPIVEPTTPGADVGAIAADFSVSPSGAATYSIPIKLPPANGGVQPALSLNYSNQGGNSLLGMGWSLGGLSAITRCPASYASDSFKGGINFDGDDRFCLDGQRLILVGGGTYGAAGSEYRTEIDTFSKIVAYGAFGNGPAYFKVWTKAGEILEYGLDATGFAPNKADGQLNNHNLSWSINKLTDSTGNYMSFKYNTNRQAGTQFLPKYSTVDT